MCCVTDHNLSHAQRHLIVSFVSIVISKMNKDNAFGYSQIFQSSQCVPSCVTYQTFIGCPDLSGRYPVASRRLDRIIVGHLPYWVSTEPTEFYAEFLRVTGLNLS